METCQALQPWGQALPASLARKEDADKLLHSYTCRSVLWKSCGLKVGCKYFLCSSRVAGLCRVIYLRDSFWTCKETPQGMERDHSRVKLWLMFEGSVRD